MTENPVRCKYTPARALPRMLVSKRRRVSGEIYKFVALAGSHIFAEKGITLIDAMLRIHLFLFHVDLRG